MFTKTLVLGRCAFMTFTHRVKNLLCVCKKCPIMHIEQRSHCHFSNHFDHTQFIFFCNDKKKRDYHKRLKLHFISSWKFVLLSMVWKIRNSIQGNTNFILQLYFFKTVIEKNRTDENLDNKRYKKKRVFSFCTFLINWQKKWDFVLLHTSSPSLCIVSWRMSTVA